MIKLDEIIYEGVKDVIKGSISEQIYAISFFVHDHQGNPLKPTVLVSYNTIDYYKKEIEDAYNEAEAKWNYAYWPQKNIYKFGLDETADIVMQWIHENELEDKTEEDENEMYDENMRYVGKGPILTQRFVEELIKVANKLHDENITVISNSKVPILIHELEYYEAIAQENEKANPDGQAAEFIEWIRSM